MDRMSVVLACKREEHLRENTPLHGVGGEGCGIKAMGYGWRRWYCVCWGCWCPRGRWRVKWCLVFGSQDKKL